MWRRSRANLKINATYQPCRHLNRRDLEGASGDLVLTGRKNLAWIYNEDGDIGFNFHGYTTGIANGIKRACRSPRAFGRTPRGATTRFPPDPTPTHHSLTRVPRRLRQTCPHRIPAPHATLSPSSASEHGRTRRRSPTGRAAPVPHHSFRAPAALGRATPSATERPSRDAQVADRRCRVTRGLRPALPGGLRLSPHHARESATSLTN
jgi:hypothetical protein